MARSIRPARAFRPLPLALTFALLLPLPLAGRAHRTTTTQLLAGTVVQVGDGDTVTIESTNRVRTKVRLVAIDAPERSQPFGLDSQRALAKRVHGRTVQVEWRERDRYDRLIGRLLLDGRDIGLEQLEQGRAWHFTAYADSQSAVDRERYAAAHRSAKANRLGLWALAEPIPPWAWRRNHPRG